MQICHDYRDRFIKVDAVATELSQERPRDGRVRLAESLTVVYALG